LAHVAEATMLHQLEDNPHIVKEVAHCLNAETNEFVQISNFYYRGNLEDFVKSGELLKLTVDRMLDWNIQMVKGVQAIHEVKGGPYIHADLQLRQLLIADDWTLKLNDFNRGT